MRLNDIMNKTKRKRGIKISKTKAYRARSYAIDLVDGSFRDQYRKIYDYAHELRKSNPHSIVRIATQPFQGDEGDIENPDRQLFPHFQRIYICLKGCMESFNSCRSTIGLDGCFLKGYYGGQLLTAIGTDPNDHNVPHCICCC